MLLYIHRDSTRDNKRYLNTRKPTINEGIDLDIITFVSVLFRLLIIKNYRIKQLSTLYRSLNKSFLQRLIEKINSFFKLIVT